MRLDQALVQQKLISSRTKAKDAIENGLVFYCGKPATKPSMDIQNLQALEIRGDLCPYVSRGGIKLEKAIHDFELDFHNKIVLDIGSSTGGFTDCALQHGAKKVIAVDVGKKQLSPTLQQNKNILLYEQTDFRAIDATQIAECTIAVSDVSFISITKMIPKLKEMPNLTDLICLIKPQFECGKEIADKYHGVIKNKSIHISVLKEVLSQFNKNGFYIKNLTFSPIQGGSGNIEYLAHFQLHKNTFVPDIVQIVANAQQITK